MNNFISYALDVNKNLISSIDAIKGENYFCPSCFEPFIFRKGKIKRPHFAHKSDSNCSNESIFHKTAKLLIQKSILDFITGFSKNRPVFRRYCSLCNFYDIEIPLRAHKYIYKYKSYCFDQFLPISVDDVVLEYRLDNGFIVDVALMSNSVPIAAIEVFYTHSVDDFKFSNLSIPFCEVSALEIIDEPFIFKCLRDTFIPKENISCRADIEQSELDFFFDLGYPPSGCIHPFLSYLEKKTETFSISQARYYCWAVRRNNPKSSFFLSV